MKKINKIIQTSLTFSKAHYNTYRIVTGKIDFEDLVESESTILLMCEPSDFADYDKIISVCKDLIDYYQEEEEYEKCAEINKVIKIYERKKRK